jgi:predicted RNase H-like HicB family nuclease
MQYAVLIEKRAGGYIATVPDLPGCIAAAGTIEDVVREIARAIDLWSESASAIPADGSQVKQMSA